MRRAGSLPWLTALLSAVLVAAALPGQAASSDEPLPGTSNEYPDGDATYRVYTPSGFRPHRRMPLLVMVHGCNTSAAQQEGANRLNQLADRKGFVVLYADHDTATNTEVGTHPVRCWRFYSDLSRDAGDPATIAGQTRAVMARWHVDPQRVYVVGMSSGAMMTSVLGATYPDLYAAIGVVAGCQYAATAACVAEPWQSVDQTDTQARLAFDAEGSFARVVPVIDIHGDADTTVTPRASERVIEQWLKTTNLVLSGNLARPLALRPAATLRARSRGKRASTTELYRDGAGCLVAERVVIHGMGHFWPGGSPDPRWYDYEDATAPSGAELVWDFFSHYRRDTTGGPCAER